MSWLNELRGASMLVAARAVDLDRDADGLGDVDRAVRPPARHVQQVARVPGTHARVQRAEKPQGIGRRARARACVCVCVWLCVCGRMGWGGAGREGEGEVLNGQISTGAPVLHLRRFRFKSHGF